MKIRRTSHEHGGAVLLEVILGLALFTVTAAIVTTGINSSVNAVERLRNSTHAGNLATTVLSEIKLGTLPSSVPEPEPFAEPFTNWTYQVVAATGDDFESAGSFQTVEVIIRNTAQPYEFRFGEILPTSPVTTTNSSSEIADDL